MKALAEPVAHFANRFVSATPPKERESWDEPDWSQWQLVRLEMPKPDGSLLEIEMLRPQEWLDSQAALVVETREVIAHPGPLDVQEARAESQESGPSVTTPNQLPESGSALRAQSPDRADATEPRATEPLDSGPSSLDSFQPMPLVPESVPVGLVVEMDLPELGLTDLAWVTDIADCPEIESRDSGRSAGGSVVTATFHHSSGDVIDLVVEDTAAVGWALPTSLSSQGLVGNAHPTSTHPSKETIGTTSNHPFWSVDRQEYVQAGQLEPGERVLTFSGDTKRIASKLARPGPQPVYNLEVHAEHVYFVGQDGLLVHNAKNYLDEVDPRRILLSQADAGRRSGDGFSVIETAIGLKKGHLRFGNEAGALPPIRVWESPTGKLWAIDHRRLASARLAQLDSIPVQRVSDGTMFSELFAKGKFTTESGGQNMWLRLTGRKDRSGWLLIE